MAEIINSNVFATDKKFVDFAGLDYFWEKAKAYVDGVDAEISGKVESLETTVNGTDEVEGLVKKVADLRAEVNALGGTEGGIQGMIDSTIAGLDLPNTYDAKGSASQALTDAKGYADGLNTAMDDRVKVLEAIDHEQLASDASAAAVATVLDGAPEKFDTLKEIAQWISDSESAATAADLVNRVKSLEDIDHDAYIAADTALETSLKGYVDGKVDGKFDAVGSASQALSDANAYTDGKLVDYTKTDAMNQAIESAKNAAIDAANETFKSYYTSSKVDELLASNSETDQAYAKTYSETYTNALFNSIQFASTTDIDGIFV